MVVVRDVQDDAEFGTQFEQNAQQRDGISSAGDRNSDPIARLQQLALTKVVEDLVAHELMVPLRVGAIKKRLTTDLQG